MIYGTGNFVDRFNSIFRITITICVFYLFLPSNWSCAVVVERRQETDFGNNYSTERNNQLALSPSNFDEEEIYPISSIFISLL